MHSVGSSSERDVDAIIDHERGAVARAEVAQLPGSREKQSRRQAGRTQLHGRDSATELCERRSNSTRILRDENQPQRSRQLGVTIVHDRAGSPPITPPSGLEAFP